MSRSLTVFSPVRRPVVPPVVPVRRSRSWPEARSVDPSAWTVWCLRLTDWGPLAPDLREVLTEEECARADRYRFPADRQRCIVGRAALRVMAGSTVGVSPRNVRLETGASGRPELAGDAFTGHGVNVSHSGDWVLCASGPSHSLGVDVEQRRADIDVMELAASVFSPWERETLATFAPKTQQHLFFDIWSRKEAVIKADGRGVAFGLDRFDVEFRPHHAAHVRRIDDRTDLPHWHLFSLDLDGEHAAALAFFLASPSGNLTTEPLPVAAHVVRPPSPSDLGGIRIG